MVEARFLLPPAATLGKAALGAKGLAWLGRAERLPRAAAGRRAQLLRCFTIDPGGWPLAALSRQADVGDAGAWSWLRADPAFLRPDMAGARMMAEGAGLALDQSDVAALLPALAPVFAEAGCVLDVPDPARWYLRLPPDTTLPGFSDPIEALGEDVFDHLPQGPASREWRRLQSEVQVVLHNHAWNARRTAYGKPPVNALWLWGGGVLPRHVAACQPLTMSDDPTCRALAATTGMVEGLPSAHVPLTRSVTMDLAHVRDPALLWSDWLQPAQLALHGGRLRHLRLDFGDGAAFDLRPGQRWRLWRKPLAGLAP